MVILGQNQASWGLMKPSVGRNEPCPCGSGRKFKTCCQAKSLSRPAFRSPSRWITPGIVVLLVVPAVAGAAPVAVNLPPGTPTIDSATADSKPVDFPLVVPSPLIPSN